jgi:stage II sporulation protein D (peptidoglycan lytic transglycosylase)
MLRRKQGIRISVSYILFLCLFATVTGAATASSLPGEAATRYRVKNTTDLVTDADFRVRVLERMRPTELNIYSGGSGLYIYVDGNERPELELAEGKILGVSISGGSALLDVGGRSIQGDRFLIRSTEGKPISVKALSGPARPSTRSYTGTLDIRTGDNGNGNGNKTTALTLINRVPVEAYVASVVGAEYGLKDLEGTKAMAVAARTFALRARRDASGSYHLLDDDRDQVYHGTSTMTKLAVRAARETEGEVLMYDGALIEALYSASNGGHSANNESIWGGKPIPYLRGRKDSWDTISPDESWRSEVSRKELHRVLSRRYGVEVKNVKFGKRSRDKRLLEVRLIAKKGKDRTITGSEFRRVVAGAFSAKTLKSTNFKAAKKGNKYRFDGHGYGHGVGLSQWGAHGMAIGGRSYREILNFYYPGTRLERIKISGADRSRGLSLPVYTADKAPVGRKSNAVPNVKPVIVGGRVLTNPSPSGESISPWTRRPRSATDISKKATGTKNTSSKPSKRRLGW